ncbi:MAG: SDR family NAD(P)-dependent oxidoreductase [Alphaproteobacteria bacterium]|nr:SDR family NAD(P)-dependent oxidoreductase [Alphaproteobacteria bacterium]MBV9061441.1 SDR family NAD(P)-dependent oxidoreductase [Alphaproteobacteria bacterium]
MNFSGKRCIVTGGTGALGAAVVARLRAAGAAVAVIARGAAPGDMDFSGVDLADPPAAAAAVNRAVEQLGGLYALVNVAGAFRWETLVDGHIATWDLLYSANLKTAVCASKAALPHLIANGGGRIVNIGAASAAKAAAGMGAYAASKAGVAKLTEALSEEVRPKGITVNAVLPSIIDTPANRADMPKADFSKWVKPDAIAELIAFLLSDAAGAITGALIPIAGRV